MAFLEVRELCKSFGKTQVLNHISFDLIEGDTLAIIGSSGGGKTTLLRCLNFLEIAEKGKISIDGKVLFDGSAKLQSDEERRKNRLHFGLVFQQFNLFPQYTALANVMLAPRLDKKLSKETIEIESKKILDDIGLKDKMNHYPWQLSGGQQQRVAIARALAMNPDVLCFDEPTSALDPELTHEVLKVIKGLSEKRKTMIVVTHEISFARDIADQIIFIDQGVIVEHGKAKDLINNPTKKRTKEFLASYQL